MNAKKSLTGCLLLWLGLVARGQAQTSTVPAAADTFLRDGAANRNSGDDRTLELSGNQRVLVRMNQSAIASAVGSGRLVSASLELHVRSAGGWGSDGRLVEAHRLTASWTEAGATWNCAADNQPNNNRQDCASPWNGGTFEEDSSDTLVQTSDDHEWVRLDVTADVAAFLAGTANQGWLLKREEDAGAGRADYASREGPAGERPRLVLVVESAANDQVPPSLAITSPIRSILVNEPSPTVTVGYSDGGSGVATSTLQVLIDGQNVTASCIAGAASASCHPAALAAGTHTIQARLRDQAGNQAQASFSFQLLLGQGPHLVSFQTVGDTYLRKSEANRNFGVDPVLRLREGGRSRALVQFDPQSLSTAFAGATLVSASLELHVEKNGRNWGRQGRMVDAHRVTAVWTETGATWNCPIDSNPNNGRSDCAAQWEGGSFAAAPTASVLHTRDTSGWVSFNVTADVAAFLSGTPNRGWLMKKKEEKRSGRVDYDSRQGTTGEGPRLVVVFTTPGGGGDTTAPTVSFTAPADGSFLASSTPTLTATYADSGSGIDTATVRLVVEGIDRTAAAQVTATGLSFTPSPPLAEGAHTAQVTVKDRAGNQAQAVVAFTTDTASPSVTITSPAPEVVGDLRIQIDASYADATSGPDSATLRVLIDEIDQTSTCVSTSGSTSCRTPAVLAGRHLLVVSIKDRAGNPASASMEFSAFSGASVLGVTITSPAEAALVRTPLLRVEGRVTGFANGLTVSVNGVSATTAPDGSFVADAPLAEGENEVLVIASDAAGGNSSATLAVTLDSRAPEIIVERPEPGQFVNQGSVHVVGEVSDRDESGVVSVTVNGAAAALADDRFEADVPLAEGGNTIVVVATDAAGNAGEVEVEAVRFTLPVVAITSPADLSFLATSTVDVQGTVSDPTAQVSVNGVAAQVSGGSFVAQDVPLIEGGNLLTATVTAANGRAGTATINVVRDLTPPRLSIEVPDAGAVTQQAAVTVAGLVNDIVAGTVNAAQVQVTVNGRPAMVVNRTFVAADVPLVPGDNTLSVEARDVSGNVGRATVTVRRTGAGPRIAVISGDRQQGIIDSALPQPLIVALLDAAGNPVPNRSVLFAVRDNDGSLAGGGRRVAVTTGGDGRASAQFTLGRRAGVQRVDALAPELAAPVTFTLMGLAGPAAQIVVDAGDQQVGVAGEPLPRPLVATVTDAGFNRREGVMVRFTVVLGRGHFATGSTEALVPTDTDGRAIVSFTLDPDEGVGNNVVEASILGLDDGPLTAFTASGRAAEDPAATSVSGVVLDNSNQPLEGVTVRILDTTRTAQTDAQGFFRIAGAQVGTLKLIVDGSTVNRPGSWPDLEFVLTTISGRDNSVNMPIYLLPLDLSRGLVVDETHGGTLTLPEIPGFSLQIAPGSVIFPGGSRSGVVSVTVVHSDKVPMVPNFGQQPRFIVTIQPAGARFDPPARLGLPNVEGLAPGSVTEMYSFDHDLGHFVSIGPATVSEDGRRILSHAGVGVIKAGWHCGGDPAAAGTTHDCGDCARCVNNRCRPLPGTRTCADDGNNCTRELCKNGECQHLPKQISRLTMTLVNRQRGSRTEGLRFDRQPARFSARATPVNCQGDPLRYEWEFGDGGTALGSTASHTYAQSNEYMVKVRARCGDCEASRREEQKQITVGYLATCYTISDENDHGGAEVTGQHGLAGTYREAFLRDVQMQGSGRGRGGELIQIDFSRGNYRDFRTIFFHTVTQINTASGQPLTANTSIAVDTGRIPLGTNVNIRGIGARRADDTGDRITGYHIDVFGGFGAAACAGWGNPIVVIEGR